ncbi:MAG: zf-HC2 domain-containing protein [Acidobacteria bacterium]|nr:zf-HC2 domain-containing protein [Acidobacteriota bacterium]
MISCKQVAELLTSDQLQSQSWWRRMEVRLHLAMCTLCARLARQLNQIRAGARGLREGNEADGGLEERLIRRLTRMQ